MHASFVRVRELVFDFKNAADDTLVIQPPNEDREAMNNPDRAGIGISDPGEGSDKLLGVGGRPHPGQVGQGGEDHHGTDGHVKPLSYFQETAGEFD